MIRAVIDPNLLVSYLLTAGDIMSRLIDHWEQSHFVYVASPAMLDELQKVIQRPRLRQHMNSDPSILLDLIDRDAEMVAGMVTVTGVCRDPKDERFIACAVEGNAAYLVTGDLDLLDLGSYQTVTMIRARDFVTLLDGMA